MYKMYSMCSKYGECVQDYWNLYKSIWIHSKNIACIQIFLQADKLGICSKVLFDDNLNFFLDTMHQN